jgi:hypothetical protein
MKEESEETCPAHGLASEPVRYESVVPNPKLKLLDQVREVFRPRQEVEG